MQWLTAFQPTITNDLTYHHSIKGTRTCQGTYFMKINHNLNRRYSTLWQQHSLPCANKKKANSEESTGVDTALANKGHACFNLIFTTNSRAESATMSSFGLNTVNQTHCTTHSISLTNNFDNSKLPAKSWRATRELQAGMTSVQQLCSFQVGLVSWRKFRSLPSATRWKDGNS